MLKSDLHSSTRRRGFIRIGAARRAIIAVATVVATAAAAPATITAQPARALPTSLSDREFWDFFSSTSEQNGYFPSENFVSNEETYQSVIPALQASLTPGGVYLGVGPEQNFTYIANLKPHFAVIFDIRRQNAMAHLMYKALFELSPTRAEFLSKLFSRPMPASLTTASTPRELFAAASAASTSDSAHEANKKAIIQQLTVKHGFALSPEDVRSIDHVYATFVEAGPDINYGYRPGAGARFGPVVPTFAQLQSMTNAAGASLAFLATEENYHAVRAMQLKNLIVPVVGNFAGPKAIKAVGQYLKERHAIVTAFYASNVEQYLFRQLGDAERFYKNVADLPIDSTSMFIRSIPPTGDRAYAVIPSIPVLVLGKDTLVRARPDSAIRPKGVVTPPFIIGRDSAVIANLSRAVAVRGSVLISGIAQIRATLQAFEKGELSSYARVMAMTKVDGWK